MHETLNHAKLAMLFRKEFELCNVQKGETIVLLPSWALPSLPETRPKKAARLWNCSRFQ